MSTHSDTPETILPYDARRSKGEQVEQMFDAIAPAYDFMNNAMTFGMCRAWRNSALRRLLRASGEPGRMLDLACGTGDVTFRLAQMAPGAEVVGADLSGGMLEVARRKLSERHPDLKDRIVFTQADALHLPYGDDSFDVITIAYGVRNFENLKAGLSEMRRVLRPGGVLCVLELCEPRNLPMRLGYKFYTKAIIPVLGRLVSRDTRAYSYLPESIAACPSRNKMTGLMQESGFSAARYHAHFPGVAATYLATK